MRKRVINNKEFRMTMLLGLDLILINMAALLALEIRFDFSLGSQLFMYRSMFLENRLIYSMAMISVFFFFGLYKSLWRYASINEMISVILASLWGNVSVFLIFTIKSVQMPKSFYIINTFIVIAVVGGLRFSYRIIRRLKADGLIKTNRHFVGRKPIRVLIVGAGDAGVMTAREMLTSSEINKVPVGFLDDDPNKWGKKINGIPVLGDLVSLDSVIDNMGIEEIVVAVPSASNKRKRTIFDICKDTGVELKTLPGLYEIIDGKVDINQIRSVEIEDLLGRDAIVLDNAKVEEYISDKTVMVTGGGGSIGSELCRQIAEHNPKTLIIFDIYENSSYDIQNELLREYGDSLDLKVLIGSVRDRKRLKAVFEKYRPNIVFHAAAHKHVPLMQESPFEAIKNNTIGTLNTAEMAGEYGADRFVLISTDKAVNPTNIMGASKRLAELVVQSVNCKYDKTDFVAVRFGNVLGSNGSVIPLFKKQIEAGGPVTVTHPEIIRYFMTIPEAVQLVLQAGSMASGGEIFILDMGEPVKIVKLAEDLIKLSGFEPYEDMDIEFTGLRPGEKLFEELLLEEEGLTETVHDKIFVGKPLAYGVDKIDSVLGSIRDAIDMEDLSWLESEIKLLVPKYKEKIV